MSSTPQGRDEVARGERTEGGAPAVAAPRSAAPILACERVHARDDAGPKNRARGSLSGLDLALGPGVHAILGAPEDGSIALIEVISGARAPLRGRVTVGGREPSRSPLARARIGALGLGAELPEADTARAAIELAMRSRGELSPNAEAILAPLGLAALLARKTRSLRYVEVRAAELALALTTPAPLLVALYEPLVDVAVQPLAALRDRLRALAAAGACVVVVTASPADATSLADRVYVLQRGAITSDPLGEGGAAIHAPGSIAELVVWVRDPDADQAGVRDLAAALSRRREVRAVTWEEHRGAGPGGSSLRVRSDDVDACSAAVLDAALETGAIIDAIAPVTPGLAEVRAAANALFARRYARPIAPLRPAPPGERVPGSSLIPVEAAPASPPEAAPAAEPHAQAEAPIEAPAAPPVEGSPATAPEEPSSPDKPTEGDPR
jgi:ABC-2 type transport system ATP-binding protein